MSDASEGSMLRRLLTGQNVKKDEIKEANVDFKILVLTPKLTETDESHETKEYPFKHENIDISYKFVSNTDIDLDYLDIEVFKKNPQNILNCADNEHIKLINHTKETFESEKCTTTISSSPEVHERKKSDTDVDLDCLDIEPVLKENPKDILNCAYEEQIESIHHAKEKFHTTFASQSGIHERKKPFKCDNCDKSFIQKSHLQRHVASVHEGIKSFQCSACGKYFTTKRSMCDHIATVHELKKPFHCDICNRCFTSKAYIAKHIAKVHEGTNLTA